MPGGSPFKDYLGGRPVKGSTVPTAGQAMVWDNTNTYWEPGAPLGIVSVLGYGAKGDGVTNDSAAIQAALNAVGSTSIVYFPQGTYLIGTTSLTIGGDNWRLMGAGITLAVLKYTGSGAAIKNSNTASIRNYLSLSDMTIDTTGASAGHRAIELENFNRPIFNNLRLNGVGAAGTGLKLIGSATLSTYLGEFHNLYITAAVACVSMNDGCNGHRFIGGVFDGAGTAVSIVSTTTTVDTNWFTGIAVQTTGATVVQLGGGASFVNDNGFINCRFEPSASNFNFGTNALRNFVLAGSYANVTFVHAALGTNANTIFVPSSHLFEYGGQAPTSYKRTLNLTNTNAGISFTSGGTDTAANLYRRTAGVVKTDADFESAASIKANQGGADEVIISARQIAPTGTNKNFDVASSGTGVVTINGSNSSGKIRLGSSGSDFKRYLTATATWDQSGTPVADGAVSNTTVTVTGAVAGDTVTVSYTGITVANVLMWANVTSNDTVTVTMFNKTGGNVSPNGTVRVGVLQH